MEPYSRDARNIEHLSRQRERSKWTDLNAAAKLSRYRYVLRIWEDEYTYNSRIRVEDVMRARNEWLSIQRCVERHLKKEPEEVEMWVSSAAVKKNLDMLTTIENALRDGAGS